MPGWVYGLAAVFLVGLALLVLAGLRDRHLRRARHEAMTRPPVRAVPGPAGGAELSYLLEEQAGTAPAGAPSTELSRPERERLRQQVRAASVMAPGMSAPGFTTDPPSGWAVLDDPWVMVCAEPVTSIRSLLPLLEPAAAMRRPCVVVAPAVADPVLRTLEINRIQRRLDVVVVLTADTTDVCAATAATPVHSLDLQSGWLPTDQLGHCRRWVSDARRSWVLSD